MGHLSSRRTRARQGVALIVVLAVMATMLGGCLCCPRPAAEDPKAASAVTPLAGEEPDEADTATSILNVTTADFQSTVLEADKPVVVDFWAVWCAPCKLVEPILDNLSRQFEEQALIVKVNVDEEPQLAEEYDIRAIPAILVFSEGEVVDTWEGVTDDLEQELAATLSRLVER